MMQTTKEETASGWTLLAHGITRQDSFEEFFDTNDCVAVDDFEVTEISSEVTESNKENCSICDSSSLSLPSLSCSTLSLGSLSSSDTETSTPLSRSKRLTFGQVSVYQHSITIGDNPSCSHGPPVSLDWTLLRSDSYNLDEYEAMIELSRGGKAKRLGRLERETMLAESGYSMHALIRVAEQVDHEKMIRTVEKMELDEMEQYQVMAAASIRRLRRTTNGGLQSVTSVPTKEASKVNRIPRVSRFMRRNRQNATSIS